AYYNRYSNLQVQRTVTVGSAFFSITQNAASSRTPGVDVDAAFVISRTLRLNTNYSFQDAKISRYQINAATLLRDVRVPRSPRHSGLVGLDWSDDIGPGRAALGGDVTYKSSFTNDIAFSAATGVLTAPLPGYAVLNVRGSYTFEGWQISGYVRNLLNKNYAVSAFIANPAVFQYWTPAEPRTFEITLKHSF
ncbi:MAG TPA: TonB-dependent receptor, partial [Sphingomonas sp.]|nr:TonB-dependent receptor [Sphingomonas sp.]